MNKNKKIIIATVSVATLFIVIGSIFLFNRKDDNPDNDIKITNSVMIKSNDEEFNATIDDTIKDVNELNTVLRKENLMLTNSIDYEGDFTCYKYIGENTDYYIAKISQVYQNAFTTYSNFKVEQEEDGKESLYVCYLATCDIQDIEYYELIVDEPEEKSISTGTGIYTLTKKDENWKFVFPVINCQYPEQEINPTD